MSIIQWFSFLTAIVLILIVVKRIIFIPEKKFIRLPVIFLGLHVILFYTYVFGNHQGFFTQETFLGVLRSNDWSSILRLHSILTFLLLEGYGYWRDKTWKINRP